MRDNKIPWQLAIQILGYTNGTQTVPGLIIIVVCIVIKFNKNRPIWESIIKIKMKNQIGAVGSVGVGAVGAAQTPDFFSLSAALLAWFSDFFCLQDLPAFSCAFVFFGALSFFLDFGGIVTDIAC